MRRALISLRIYAALFSLAIALPGSSLTEERSSRNESAQHQVERSTQAVSQPDFKLPLPPGKDWLLSTETGTPTSECKTGIGGRFYGGGYDCLHSKRSKYSLDFVANTRQGGHVADVDILAAADGIVSTVVLDPGQQIGCGCYGNYVIIDHGNGFTTTYGHLKDGSIQPNISEGQPVKRGDKLGLMGTSGDSTGIHIHFETRYRNQGVKQGDLLDQVLLDGRRIVDYKVGSVANPTYYPSTNYPGDTQQGSLNITFNQNPVSQLPGTCTSTLGLPQWSFRITLTETAGVGINIGSFSWAFYDSNGNLVSTQNNSATDFANFFNRCGPGATRLAPDGQACADLCVHLSTPSGTLTMTFSGTDDNGNNLTFNSPTLVLLGRSSAANLQVTFNPDPVPQATSSCVGVSPAWDYNVTLSETGGVGFVISMFIIDYYDRDGNKIGTGSITGQQFASYRLCNSTSTVGTHVAANSSVCIPLCSNLAGRTSGSLVLTFSGTDDNGNNLAFSSNRLVLSGTDSAANLQISFNQSAVPQLSRACNSALALPQWGCRATLNETAGVGITIASFSWAFYDNNGNLLATQANTATDFANFFNACGTGSTRIAAHAQACGDLCIHLGTSSGALILTFSGTDDNGHQITFTSPRLALLGPGAILHIAVNQNPVPQDRFDPCQSVLPAWYFTWSFTETNGVGITITRRIGDFYDASGNYLQSVTYGDGLPRVDPNSQVSINYCAHLWGRGSGSVVDTFYGTDDNGNSLSFRTDPVLLSGSTATSSEMLKTTPYYQPTPAPDNDQPLSHHRGNLR